MNIKQLEAFVQIAEGKSFSKAAKDLFLTQPTISAHISSLEKELNARLLIRNTKEVYLSEEGKRLYGYAKQIVDLEKKIFQMFNSEMDKKKLITIAASTIPAQYVLPKILAEFSKQYPKEQLKILETDSAKAAEEVMNHSVDIGFTGTVLEEKHCKHVPFYQDELVIITPNSEKYLRFREEERGIDWILEEPIIMREEGSGTRRESEKQLKESEIDISKLNIIASIENQETIKQSVRKGVGISIISRLAVEEEGERGDLLVFPLPNGKNSRNLNIIYSKDFQLSHSAVKFIKVVKEMYMPQKMI